MQNFRFVVANAVGNSATDSDFQNNSKSQTFNGNLYQHNTTQQAINLGDLIETDFLEKKFEAQISIKLCTVSVDIRRLIMQKIINTG